MTSNLPPDSETERPQASSETQAIEAFIDALGVVMARIVTMLVISSVGVAPFAAAVLLIHSDVLRPLFLGLSLYSFLFISIILFIEYYYLYRGENDMARVTEAWPDHVKAIFAVTMLPALPVIIGVVFMTTVAGKRLRISFVNKSEFDIFSFYFYSVYAFSFMVFLIMLDSGLAGRFLSGTYEISYGQAVMFTVDLMLKGVLFDVFEHFGITVTSASQTSDLLGKLVSFILRITSSVLIISIAVQLFHDTRKKLAGMNR